MLSYLAPWGGYAPLTGLVPPRDESLGSSPVLVTASLFVAAVSGAVPCVLRHLAFVAPGVRDGTAFASADSAISHVTACRADISKAVHSPLLYGLVR